MDDTDKIEPAEVPSQPPARETLTYMETPTTARPVLLDELTALVLDRHYLEGLVRRLENRFRGQGLDVDGAVGDAIETMTKKAESLQVKDPPAYLYAIAANLLRREAKEHVLFPVDALDDHAHVAARVDVVDDALRTDVFKYVKSLIERWENKSLRVTALLVMEASFVGEPIPTEELAEQLEEILGEEVSLTTVRKWKERSLDRLADELRDQGFID